MSYDWNLSSFKSQKKKVVIPQYTSDYIQAVQPSKIPEYTSSYIAPVQPKESLPPAPNSLPAQPEPQVVPTPIQHPTPTPAPQLPDIVSPFRQPETTEVTQGVGENPNSWQYGYGPQGHEGVDMINSNYNVTNPIGGINVSGFTPGKGYGNWQVVVGASPEELKQMDPQTEEGIRQQVVNFMMQNPADIRSLDIPGKNVSLQAHLANPAPTDAEIATGSANLTMGGSGYQPIHLHSALRNNQGEMVNILNEIARRARR